VSLSVCVVCVYKEYVYMCIVCGVCVHQFLREVHILQLSVLSSPTFQPSTPSYSTPSYSLLTVRGHPGRGRRGSRRPGFIGIFFLPVGVLEFYDFKCIE
jgi:hypothetical protein